MKDPIKAETLARQLMAIARGYGKKVSALITNMDQPLGRFAGNSLEIEECLAIMKNEHFIGANGKDLYEDTRELSLQLSAQMLHMGGATKTIEDAYHLAQVSLASGRALEKFKELCRAQLGRLSELPKPQYHHEVFVPVSGYIQSMDTEQIGIAGIQIKAGRAHSNDVIEPTAGIEFHYKVGDRVEAGKALFTLHGANLSLLQSAADNLKLAVKISAAKISPQPLILKTLF